MAGLKLKISLEGAQEMISVLENADLLIEAGFEEALYFLLQKAQENLEVGGHIISGNLSRSGKVTLLGPLKGEVAFTANYASFLQEGTRPHKIVPKFKKALSWIPRTGGSRVFAKRVQHPGIDPPIKFLLDYPGYKEHVAKMKEITLRHLVDKWEALP